MIDIRKLKELVRLMVENDLSELDLRDQEETVTLRRPIAAPPGAHPHTESSHATTHAPQAQAPVPAAPEDDTDGLHAITCPMVGTFYSAPNPDSPAFVSVGSNVGNDSVVCVVEAMKVFSEIKAECSGSIEKVLVNNGDPVEFGQKLFLVKPN